MAEALGLGERSLKNMLGKGGACCLSCLTHDTCWHTRSWSYHVTAVIKVVWLMLQKREPGTWFPSMSA